MEETSILTSIKKMLGVPKEYDHFDLDITININSALMNLTQLGIGPSAGFKITGESETWTNLLGTKIDMEAVKTYVYLKCKIVFDPPTSSFVLESIKHEISEMEWRLNAQAEGGAVSV